MAARKPWPTMLGLGFCLILALFLRWPMMTAAERHLDSDLAVDGLTLRQFVAEGRWRWHYPGTPHIGTAPVLLSLPAVAIWGEEPASLVFAGVAGNLLLIAGVYLLVLRTYGSTPAFFSGLILAAGGLGQVWLSGRVTGGHLLAAAWLAWAWLGWSYLIQSKKIWPWAPFGLFCSLGLWVDSIFLLSLPALGVASLAEAWARRDTIKIQARIKQALVFIAMLPIGPGLLKLGDGVNVYGAQFELTHDTAVLKQHARLLVLECLPRLVFGRTLKMGSPEIALTHQKPADYLSPTAAGAFVWISIFIVISLFILVDKIDSPTKRPINAASWSMSLWLGQITIFLLNIIAFKFNKNIYNADNYRYLVLLLPTVGLLCGLLATTGRHVFLRRLLLATLATFMSTDVILWQSQNSLRPSPFQSSKLSPGPETNGLVTLLKNPDSPINGTFEADYWEVYRSLYLARRPVTLGRPFGFFPNRFQPESPTQPRFVVITKSPTSMQIMPQLRAESARLILSQFGLEIYDRHNAQTKGPQP